MSSCGSHWPWSPWRWWIWQFHWPGEKFQHRSFSQECQLRMSFSMLYSCYITGKCTSSVSSLVPSSVLLFGGRKPTETGIVGVTLQPTQRHGVNSIRCHRNAATPPPNRPSGDAMAQKGTPSASKAVTWAQIAPAVGKPWKTWDGWVITLNFCLIYL